MSLRAVCEVVAARLGVPVVTIPRAGHNPQTQNPTAFNDLLRSFLRQQLPR